MRDIDVDKFGTVELWKGRRLLLLTDEGMQLFALPRGALTTTRYNGTMSALFGSGANATRLTGSHKKGRLAALVAVLIEMERPAGSRVLP